MVWLQCFINSNHDWSGSYRFFLVKFGIRVLEKENETRPCLICCVEFFIWKMISKLCRFLCGRWYLNCACCLLWMFRILCKFRSIACMDPGIESICCQTGLILYSSCFGGYITRLPLGFPKEAITKAHNLHVGVHLGHDSTLQLLSSTNHKGKYYLYYFFYTTTQLWLTCEIS